MQKEQTSKNYILYSEFETEKLKFYSPEAKKIPNPPGVTKPQATYYQLPIAYNFSQKQGVSAFKEFFIEGPELETKTGIRSEPAQQGDKMMHSLPCRFDLSDDQQVKFLGVINSFREVCVAELAKVKGQVGLHYFDAKSPDALFKDPIFRPRDKITGDLLEGASPSIFFRLFKRGKLPYVTQTVFTGLDSTPLNWNMLQMVTMKFIPLIHIKHIYCGAKASIQMEVVSAVITRIVPVGSASMQMSTISRIREQNPDLVESVASQIARVSSQRQDQITGNDTQGEANNSESGPTFSGLSNNDSHEKSPAQQEKHTGGQGTIPTMNFSMDGFTSAAPKRDGSSQTDNRPVNKFS